MAGFHAGHSVLKKEPTEKAVIRRFPFSCFLYQNDYICIRFDTDLYDTTNQIRTIDIRGKPVIQKPRNPSFQSIDFGGGNNAKMTIKTSIVLLTSAGF